MRKTIFKIVAFCIAIAIVTLAFSAHQISERVADSETRSYLSARGIYTTATESARSCSRTKGSIEVTFSDEASRKNTECISRIGDDVSIARGNIGDRVDIVYDPADHSRVYLAPGGNLPQRNVEGAWRRWMVQNFFVLMIVWTFVAIAVWRADMKNRPD